MQLPIAVHKGPESVYVVPVPDVPGCFSCGDTLDEAVKNAKEAVLGHLEILLEDGEHVWHWNRRHWRIWWGSKSIKGLLG